MTEFELYLECIEPYERLDKDLYEKFIHYRYGGMLDKDPKLIRHGDFLFEQYPIGNITLELCVEYDPLPAWYKSAIAKIRKPIIIPTIITSCIAAFLCLIVCKSFGISIEATAMCMGLCGWSSPNIIGIIKAIFYRT